MEFNGRLWWYREAAIKLADGAPTAAAAARRPTTGDRVTVTDDYRSHGDAGDGEWCLGGKSRLALLGGLRRPAADYVYPVPICLQAL